MRRRALTRGRVLIALMLGACGGSTGPDTGGLQVSVAGLPSGTAASLSVTGSRGYARALVGAETLTGLQPGSYTVAAAAVAAGGTVYGAEPASQTVTVSEGNTAASTVTYVAASGSLALTVSGLPPGADAAVLVTGPGGYSRQLAASTTLRGLLAGSYTLTAQPVAANGTQYAGTPSSQQASVGSAPAGATVTYAESVGQGLNFRIDGVYLTQSVQTYTGTVPLVAGRDAFLRVFVTASEANALSPDVRVRFYHGGVLALERIIPRLGLTPLAPQEGTLGSSWNLAVPKSLVTTNLSIQVEVDPADTQAETDETDNSFPAGGAPLALQVETAATFQVILVPVVTSVDGRRGNVTSANRDQYLAATLRMHPISSIAATIGSPFTTDVPALEPENTGSWNTILNELEASRVGGDARYYYGVVNPTYSGGVAGIAYVGGKTALGWDKLPSAASVAAHEWGHNWGRDHAPCGDAANPDDRYPYTGGIIGVFGFDVGAGALKPNSSHDLMGYCDEEWISDYTYRGVMQYRSAQSSVASAFAGAIQPSLVVWGRIENGRPVLEPAFQTTTRPSLPKSAGPYTLEARSGDGSRVFQLSFSPLEVADDATGGKQFAFAVPLTPERRERIELLRLSGPEGSATIGRGAGGAADVEITSAGPGRVALRWDASRTPMVVVRDPRSGQILSFARGGRAEVAADQPDLSLTLSDRVRSRELLVRVPGR
ncbi:MAG: hypothetical protein H0T68_05050 [Gemmatimonadales bacterium]|nr:hypothetical protein [Gemmatimonadales bacterium]